MKLTVRKSGEELAIVLPDDVVAKFGWKRGDVLSAEVVEGGLKIRRIQTIHDRAMGFVRRCMVKYRKTFEILAKT
ncbi:MAG: AbrB/MazE/SpoVT family DNA-binding domain-containing protein [Pseudolabrys sp.]|jgi:antitoxin component of MazEF toxin-antitoxin module